MASQHLCRTYRDKPKHLQCEKCLDNNHFDKLFGKQLRAGATGGQLGKELHEIIKKDIGKYYTIDLHNRIARKAQRSIRSLLYDFQFLYPTDSIINNFFSDDIMLPIYKEFILEVKKIVCHLILKGKCFSYYFLELNCSNMFFVFLYIEMNRCSSS